MISKFVHAMCAEKHLADCDTEGTDKTVSMESMTAARRAPKAFMFWVGSRTSLKLIVSGNSDFSDT